MSRKNTDEKLGKQNILTGTPSTTLERYGLMNVMKFDKKGDATPGVSDNESDMETSTSMRSNAHTQCEVSVNKEEIMKEIKLMHGQINTMEERIVTKITELYDGRFRDIEKSLEEAYSRIINR